MLPSRIECMFGFYAHRQHFEGQESRRILQSRITRFHPCGSYRYKASYLYSSGGPRCVFDCGWREIREEVENDS
ncbi:hypothetical protein RB195_021345 [Necator americanus]|uniref:Uncharacterized protein n=1 Tax=Necator americanus TaxID=51031 RepID=A0ABR1EAK2_NECAM